jgi:hypothetical protein
LAISFLWAPLQNLRIAGLGALVLFSAPLSNAFGVCIVHTLDIYRYRVTYGGYLLFALAAMCVFLVAVLCRTTMHFVSNSRGRENQGGDTTADRSLSEPTLP